MGARNAMQVHRDRRKRSVAVLALGYELYGSPAATFNGKEVIVAQAIIWPSKRKA